MKKIKDLIVKGFIPYLSKPLRSLTGSGLVRAVSNSGGDLTGKSHPCMGRHHHLFLLVFFLLFTISAVTVYAMTVKTITISVDGQLIRLRTAAANVKTVLADQGFVLSEGDRVLPGLEAATVEGMEVTVERGVNLLFSIDGREVPFRSVPLPVRDVLANAGITLGPLDKTSVPLEEKVWEGLRIKVTRVTTEQIFTQAAVKPRTVYIKDSKLEMGRKKVLTKGEPGLMEKEYEVVYEDGQEVKRTLKGEKILKKVVQERVALGTKPHTLVTRGGTIKYKEMRVMNASAYTPGPESCGIYADGYTATGKKAGYGIVAVDPRVIPLGTKLYIEGYGFAAAEDVGSAIKGNRIDLCYETVREALLFGRRKVKVYILVP